MFIKAIAKLQMTPTFRTNILLFSKKRSYMCVNLIC